MINIMEYTELGLSPVEIGLRSIDQGVVNLAKNDYISQAYHFLRLALRLDTLIKMLFIHVGITRQQ